MNRDGFPGFVLNTMKNLNMVMILYLTMVTVHSLYGYMDGNSAMDFLMQVKRMPMEPWKLPVLSIGLFVCLLLLLPEQERGSGENGSGTGSRIRYQLCAEFQLHGHGASYHCRYHELLFRLEAEGASGGICLCSLYAAGL